jgi:hypothetical protein
VCANGHGTYFYSCLGRRSEKTCTSEGINYTQFENTILKHIKDLDWSAIYTGKGKNNTALNNCRMQILEIEQKITAFNNELIYLDDDDLELRVIRKIRKNKEILKELIADLNKYMLDTDTNIEFKPNLNLVYDQDNFKLRQDTNVSLRRIIKAISITRSDKFVSCWIQYYTESISHLFIYDIKLKDVISKTYVTDSLTFNFDAGSINIVTGEITLIGTELKKEDEIAFNIWQKLFGLAIEQAVNK